MRTNSARPIRSPAGSRRAAGPTNRFARAAACLVAAAGLCAAIGSARAATDDDERLARAESVLAEFAADELRGIPIDLLRRAHGIAVIPGVIRGGFLLGARRGRGVLTVRTAGGRFANPAFITLTGGSFGWQIGAQSTDIILVFKTRKGVDDISRGKLTLGADASIAAGPVGRHTGVATDIEFQAEVFSYSRSRGLFAGVALEGAGVTIDRSANAAFYGTAEITPEQIFTSSGNAAPAVANNFVQLLSAQTRRLPTQPGMEVEGDRQPDGSGVSTVPEPAPSVRTYGIGDPDTPESDEDWD